MPTKSLIPLILLPLVACGHGADRHLPEPKAAGVVARPVKVQEFERVSVSGTLTAPGNSSSR